MNENEWTDHVGTLAITFPPRPTYSREMGAYESCIIMLGGGNAPLGEPLTAAEQAEVETLRASMPSRVDGKSMPCRNLRASISQVRPDLAAAERELSARLIQRQEADNAAETRAFRPLD